MMLTICLLSSLATSVAVAATAPPDAQSQSIHVVRKQMTPAWEESRFALPEDAEDVARKSSIPGVSLTDQTNLLDEPVKIAAEEYLVLTATSDQDEAQRVAIRFNRNVTIEWISFGSQPNSSGEKLDLSEATPQQVQQSTGVSGSQAAALCDFGKNADSRLSQLLITPLNFIAADGSRLPMRGRPARQCPPLSPPQMFATLAKCAIGDLPEGVSRLTFETAPTDLLATANLPAESLEQLRSARDEDPPRAMTLLDLMMTSPHVTMPVLEGLQALCSERAYIIRASDPSSESDSSSYEGWLIVVREPHNDVDAVEVSFKE